MVKFWLKKDHSLSEIIVDIEKFKSDYMNLFLLWIDPEDSKTKRGQVKYEVKTHTENIFDFRKVPREHMTQVVVVLWILKIVIWWQFVF